MRNETPEESAARIAKSQATRAETQVKRLRKLKVGNWQVFQFDDYNWCCNKTDEEGDRTNYYFPDLIHACNSMLIRCGQDAANSTGNVKDIIAAFESAKDEIINQIRAGVLSDETTA
jgi:hypothetical protein